MLQHNSRININVTKHCIYYSSSDSMWKLKVRISCSCLQMFLNCEPLGGGVDHSLLISPRCFRTVAGALPVFQHVRVFVCLYVCVCACVWSLSLPYHPWPLQRVITWSSTADSKVSTADSSNNADPPSARHHFCRSSGC